MYARLAAKATTRPMAAAADRTRWLDGIALGLLAASALAGAAVGLGAAWPALWPLSLLSLSAWAWLVLLAARRSARFGLAALSVGWLAWHLVGQGWVAWAVREGEHALAWRAAVLAVMLVFQLAPLVLAWLLLAPLGGPRHRAAGAIVLRWGVSVACAESLRQLGWWGSGYASLGVVFIDLPGARALVPHIGGAGLGLLVLAWCGVVALAAWHLASRATRAARRAAGLACISAVAAVAWPAAEPTTATTGEAMKIWAVQPPAERGRRWTRSGRDDALAQLEAAIAKAPAGALLVTAETFFPEPPPRAGADTRWADLVRQARRRDVHLLIGMPHLLRDDQGMHLANAVVQVSPERGSLYAKERLVPGGEYLPWPGVLGPVYQRLFERVRDGQRSGPPELTTPMFVGGSTVGVTICHELAFPLILAARAQGAGWLANVADDGWIDQALYRRQMVGLARLRALETGKPLLRVSQGGPTLLVGADGRIQARSASEHLAEQLPLTLRPREQAAPYQRIATGVAAAPLLLAVLLVVLTGWLRTPAAPTEEGETSP
ncbi:MAG: apolipoprotein N-acyltransferase [Pseudomonadota bacterium]